MNFHHIFSYSTIVTIIQLLLPSSIKQLNKGRDTILKRRQLKRIKSARKTALIKLRFIINTLSLCGV